MATLPKTITLYTDATTNISSPAFSPGGNTASTNNTRSILKLRDTIGGATVALQIKWKDGVFRNTDDTITVPAAYELNYSPGTILRLNITGQSSTTISAEVDNAVDG